MRAYAIRRLLLIIPTMFIVTVLLFFLFRMIPGDVIEMMGMELSWEQGEGTQFERDAEAIAHMLGLDAPPHIQYLRWLGVWPVHEDDGAALTASSRATSAARSGPDPPLWNR